MAAKNRIQFLILGLLLTACSAFQVDEKTGDPIDPRVRAEQEAEIQKPDQNLANGYFSVAREQYAEFQKKFPNSVFYQRSIFGQAQSLEGEKKWAEAAEMYRANIEATRVRQPEIAAQALYRISICYENLGDESRVLASLRDSLTMKEYLNPEQAEAEIPARMAASYSRMGLQKEAKEQLEKADQGAQRVIKQNLSTMDQSTLNAWSAKIYYSMGSFSTQQANSENLQGMLDSFKLVQIFSLRSIELGVDPWSNLARKELVKNYESLWDLVIKFPKIQGLDAEAAVRQKNERQSYFAGQILTLLNELKAAQVVSEDMRSQQVKDLFKDILKYQDKLEQFLYAQGEFTKLTPEALKRQQLNPKRIKLQDPHRHD